MLAEGITEIQYVVLKTQGGSHALRLHDTLLGSAVKPTPIASQGGVGIGYWRLGIGNWGRVEGAESGTHEFVTLLQEQNGCHGGVNTTRHTYENTFGHIFRFEVKG